MYKISIILPTYNVETYLRKCFESLLSQTIGFNNLQIIFVDDLSTDNSREIIDKYAEKYENVLSIHLPKNSGFAGKPRNEGIKYAFAEYLLFLDPDDILMKESCEILYNKIKETNVDIVVAGYKKEEWIAKWHSLINSDETLIENTKECLSVFYNPPGLAAKLFKKDLIIKNNITFPEKIPAQDLVFLTETYLTSKSILSLNNIIVYEYIVRNDEYNKSITQKSTKKYLMELLSAYNITFDLLEKFNVTNILRKLYFTKNHFNFFRVQLKNAKLNDDELKELFESKSFLKFRHQNFIHDDDELNEFFTQLTINHENTTAKTLQSICKKTKSEYINKNKMIGEKPYIPKLIELKENYPIENIEKELYSFIKQNVKLNNYISDSQKQDNY